MLLIIMKMTLLEGETKPKKSPLKGKESRPAGTDMQTFNLYNILQLIAFKKYLFQTQYINSFFNSSIHNYFKLKLFLSNHNLHPSFMQLRDVKFMSVSFELKLISFC